MLAKPAAPSLPALGLNCFVPPTSSDRIAAVRVKVDFEARTAP
jgi:hypothetical protein